MMMAARTNEQKTRDAERDELISLRSQLAFLGGGVCAAIHDGKVEGLAAMIRHIPYLASLPAFKAMTEWMDREVKLPPGQDAPKTGSNSDAG